MTKDELIEKIDEHGNISERIYVFATDELDSSAEEWTFGILLHLYEHKDHVSFGIANENQYMNYRKFVVCFNDFNPNDMNETLKHVITLND